MTVTLNRLVVAWLMTAGIVDSSNPNAWGYGGLAFFAGSFLP